MSNFYNNFKVLDLDLHGVRLPSFDIEKKSKHNLKVSEDINNYDFLRELCLAGFKDLKIKKDSDEYSAYVDRAKHELKILKSLGFVDYILLVWDVINYCNENRIPTGLGRGSAAGSLVLFLIGVTKIDPVKYGLYFERFVSKARAKKKVVDGVTYLDGSLMCDVDLDICYYRRPDVLKYLEEKFSGNTSKILTLNTLSTRLLIKECGKIVGEKSESEMNEITAIIPKMFGIIKSLEESYEEVEEFANWCDDNEEIYGIALKLRGLVKNKGVHPSGVLLSYHKMDESCPTELSSDKVSVSSYDMNWSALFNVKLDLLGLRGVSVAHDVCNQMGIKMEDVDLNHPTIYQNLQDLQTAHGLFQIEADMAHKVSQQVKPKNLEELSAVLALARPGAMAYVKQYADYANHDVYDPIHPFFDDI
jgi:DNA polymerase-3 subunit alpha